MGRDLARASDVARRTFEEADDALGFALSRLMWDGSADELTATSNAQPALLVHSVAVHRLVSDRLGAVAMAAGHSLGEFSAWVASGGLDFIDGVRTVRRRGELMYRSGLERPGTMAALLGVDEEAAAALCRAAASESGVCVPANYNSPGQIVISGDRPSIDRAIGLAREAGAKRALPLNVSGAFHSPLMEMAEAGLSAQLEGVAFGAPAFPIVSNVTAGPVTDPAEARRLLVRQLTAPVRWTESVRTMVEAGIRSFVELGPGSVLAGLVRRIDRQAEVRSIGTWSEVEEALGNG
jgi:[acyl-carrier-protein] S-malonyltransferase